MEKVQQVLAILAISAIALVIGFYTYSGISGRVVDTNSADKIEIAFIGPLTGDFAEYGQEMKMGVEMALRDSGLENVQIKFYDSQCSFSESLEVMNEIASDGKTVAVIGDACDDSTIVAASIAEENKIVLISPGASSIQLSNAGDYIFRTVPSDAKQAETAARLLGNAGYKRIAIIRANDVHGESLAYRIKAELGQYGSEIVAEEILDGEDINEKINSLEERNPDGIYLISSSPAEDVESLRLAREMLPYVRRFASDGLKNERTISLAGKIAEGIMISAPSDGTDIFASKYREVYGEEPGEFAAQGYDAFSALVWAIGEGARTSTEIKNSLYAANFEGASGRVGFDSLGDVGGDYYAYEVVDGKFRKVQQFRRFFSEDSR